ncbi:MAG TPA: hypothetical protein VFY23_15090, partial [Candidatus Limnocylindrales bacterium]|nr:hypothetical protein [Candidatus Limnocylindrales bacterium]
MGGFRATGAALRRPALRAALAAALLVAVSVLPATAASGGPTSLVNAEVSPRSGTTKTTIDFAVTYRNSQGAEPQYVRVKIGDAVHDMRPSTASQDWKKGGRFVYSTRLAVGTHEVTFLAADAKRHDTALAGGSVTIEPAPTPKPTPKP